MKKLPYVLAIIVGAVSVLPYVLSYIVVQTPHTQTLHYFYQDSELVYLTRIREVIEGHIHLASPFFFEYKSERAIQQPYGEWLYAIGSLWNINYIVPFALFSKFLFPALLFLLVYSFVNLLLNNNSSKQIQKYISLFIAVLITLGFDFNNIGFWKATLNGEYSQPILSLWTRLVNPITGALALFGTFNLFFLSEKKRSGIHVIGAGLLLGFSSGYIFSFSLGLVIFGLLLLFAFFERNWIRAQNVFCILLIAFVINSFYFYTLVTEHTDIASLTKNGLLITHQALHNKVLYLVSGVFFIVTILRKFIFKEKEIWSNISWQWSFAVLLASYICLNQQIVTGKTVWPGHFVQYTNILNYIVFFTSIFHLANSFTDREFIKTKNWYLKIIKISVIVFVISTFAITILNTRSIYSNREVYIDSQRYSPILEWLQKSGGEFCVVFPLETEERIEKFITAYTQCDLYHSAYVFSNIPDDRILHNYILELRLLGIKKENIEVYLKNNPERIRRYFFDDWVNIFYLNNDPWVQGTKDKGEHDKFIQKETGRITLEFIRTANIPIAELLKEYLADFIIVDTKYTSDDNISYLFPAVYSSNQIKIFAIPR